MRQLCSILLIIISLVHSNAQIIGFQYSDIPQNVIVNQLYESKDHSIWIATNNGVYQFNGLSYEKLDISNIENENFTAIYQDNKKNIIFGCESGNIYWCDYQLMLNKWSPKDGTPQKKITAIHQDKNGNIWLSTYGEGVYVFDQTYLYNFNKNDGLFDDAIYDMVIDDNNNVWVATDQGINICNFNDKKKLIRKINRTNGLSDELIQCISLSYDRKSILAGYQNGGIDQIEIKTQTIKQNCVYSDLQDIHQLIQLSDNHIIAATRNNGAFQIINSDTTIITQIVQSNKIYSLFLDSQSNIWISTAEKGLINFNLLFQKIEFDENVQIQKKFDDLVGTNHGLYLNQSGQKKLLSDSKLNVVSIGKDLLNNYWIGTFGQGLYRYANQKITKFPNLPDPNVLSIQSYNNSILIATLSGIYKITSTDTGYDITDFNLEIRLPKYYVYKLFQDKSGVLWIGTDGKGLYKYDGKMLFNYDELNQVKFKTVYSIDEDKQHHIWFGSEEVGLVEIDNNKLNQKIIKGLRSNHIIDIVCGDNNQLLLAHDKGIDLIDTKKNEALYLDHIIANFQFDNILNSNNYKNKKFEISSGNKIYFLDSRFLKSPTINIQKIEVNGEKNFISENSDFNSDKNNFHFYLSSMFLNYSLSPSYEYFLEGYDTKWRNTQSDVVEYQNLNSNHYVFKARAIYSSASSETIEYQFNINLPFWKKWWFISLILLLVAIGFYLWVNYRDKKNATQMQFEREKIENQLITLKSQINPHFLFNTLNTLIAIIESNPNLAVNYVTRMSDFYRKIMLYREENRIPIVEEISLIEDYTFLIKKRFGDNISILNHINNTQDFIVPFALQMLIENAVKHNIATKDHPLIIELYDNEEFIFIKNNYQQKKVKEPSTGFGLSFIKKHYEFLSKIHVEIQNDDEYFIVKLPILKNESTHSRR